MKVIQPYVIALWEERLPAIINLRAEKAINVANSIRGIQIATSLSTRRGVVRIEGAIHNTLSIVTDRELTTYLVTLEARTKQNLYTAELAAIVIAIKRLPLHLVGRQITIVTSN
jgi:hypothetical protein